MKTNKAFSFLKHSTSLIERMVQIQNCATGCQQLIEQFLLSLTNTTMKCSLRQKHFSSPTFPRTRKVSHLQFGCRSERIFLGNIVSRRRNKF